MRGSVLFVDDQVEITDLIQRMLKDEDYDQYFANSGTEALEIMEKHAIDVIVTDMVMPLVSGLQLLSIIKEKYPDTVRIVLSGQLQIASVLAAINSGEVYRYITKPWKVDTASKMIIRQALDYAVFLKKRNRFVEDDGCIPVRSHAFLKVLSHLKDTYILVQNGVVIEAGQLKGLCIEAGDKLEDVLSLTDLSFFHGIELSSDWILYLKPPE